MPWKPLDEYDKWPTLGYYVLDWLAENLTVYDGPTIGQPLEFTQEQADFVLRFYEVDPTFDGPATRAGERHVRRGRLVRRALLSRPKGWGKSPLVAALCIVEALADVVMDGFDANGQPVGRPWNDIGLKPLVQIVAVSEDQTANTWMPCLDMLRNSPVLDNYSVEPMETFINVPRGRIEAVTSAGLSREGFRPIFTALDQALALDTPIPTPDGWRDMGDLEAGDYVYGTDGPVRISEAKPASAEHDCYRVTFADGTSVVASAGHLWTARRLGSTVKRGSIRTTEQMIDGTAYQIPAAPYPGRAWISILSIEPVPKVAVRCIAVESEDHLFACGEGGHFTHNTESWLQSNGGWRLARTIRRNTMKTGGSTIETPNAFEPGEESIAEQSWNAHQTQLKGRHRTGKRDLLLDHREASATTDVYDRDSLRSGLLEAYGDSASDNGGWVSIDGVIDEYLDLNTDPQEARRYFLNQITHSSDSFLSAQELAACVEPKPVTLGSPIVLGFDGSMGRAKGKADATALVAVRLEDGYAWQVLIREPPNNPREAREWTAPTFEFDQAVQQMHRDYRVIAFYADPTGWEALVSRWEELFGRRYKIKAGGDGKHPIMLWPRGKSAQVPYSIKRLKASILASGQARTAAVTSAMGDKDAMKGVGEFSYDGSFELTSHLLNARMRKSTSGYLLAKEFPESARKCDGAYALVMAWKAFLDAVAQGWDRKAVAVRQVITLG